jgi:hypothetical protein
MGKIINFRLTQKAIYRAAVKEMEKMYQLSSGGTDPIINEASREMFEEGQIDEVQWIDWRRYCLRVLNRIGGENLEKQ